MYFLIGISNIIYFLNQTISLGGQKTIGEEVGGAGAPLPSPNLRHCTEHHPIDQCFESRGMNNIIIAINIFSSLNLIFFR